MIKLVISGGQTGADLAGLRAARKLNIPTGGWAPKGYKTERGNRPVLLGKIYGLQEHHSPKYPVRTTANIDWGDLTLIIATKMDSGSELTRKMCLSMLKPVFHIRVDELDDRQSFYEILRWIKKRKHSIVNIAGNRESKSPGIGKKAEKFLEDLFTAINVF